MKTSLNEIEKAVLVELTRRAREVGNVRRVGLTLPLVAELTGLERRSLERAMDPTEKVTARTLSILCVAWRVTWADLLGVALGRTVLAKAKGRPRTLDEWEAMALEATRPTIESRRTAPLPGRDRLYYQGTADWGDTSQGLAALVCLAPCVREVLSEAWAAPRK